MSPQRFCRGLSSTLRRTAGRPPARRFPGGMRGKARNGQRVFPGAGSRLVERGAEGHTATSSRTRGHVPCTKSSCASVEAVFRGAWTHRLSCSRPARRRFPPACGSTFPLRGIGASFDGLPPYADAPPGVSTPSRVFSASPRVGRASGRASFSASGILRSPTGQAKSPFRWDDQVLQRETRLFECLPARPRP